MVQGQPKTVRVKFEKTGKLRYISHLDLLRTMQTALRRAKVDMEYSEGFNPHMKLSFASALSVGVTSDAEYMDLELSEPMAEGEDGLHHLHGVVGDIHPSERRPRRQGKGADQREEAEKHCGEEVEPSPTLVLVGSKVSDEQHHQNGHQHGLRYHV